MPTHVGAHPQMPAEPLPPHVRGVAHAFPGQHAWALPPQVPQSPVPHAVPFAHALHTLPPCPHALGSVPGWHTEPMQHPAHDSGSQMQLPAEHRSPLGQLPYAHTPPQPSPAPHALFAQLGVHVPAPHTLAAPPAPHVSPLAHPPQSMIAPQAFFN